MSCIWTHWLLLGIHVEFSQWMLRACVVWVISGFNKTLELKLLIDHKREGIIFFLFFLGLHLQHREIPWPGNESELQLLACATAALDLSCICNLHRSLRQRQFLNPLNKTRYRTCILRDDIVSLNCWDTTETPRSDYFLKLLSLFHHFHHWWKFHLFWT